MNQVFTTAGLPAAERFASWHEAVVSEATMLVSVRTRFESDFLASARITNIGEIQTFAIDNPPVEVDRTASLIRRSDPGEYHLILTADDGQQVSQDRRHATISSGDMVLYHTSRPLRTRPDPRVSRQQSVLITVPERSLPLPAVRLRQLVATRLPGDDRIGSLVAAYLRTLACGVGPIHADDAVALARTTVDLISVMLAHRLDGERRVPVESRENALLAQAQSYALTRLDQADLNPSRIAAAQHVSVRTLHRLFHANGMSVTRWIRDRRLERCRLDLANPAFATWPVRAVGARWGLPDAARFSRLFKETYGVSPAAFRAGRLPSGTGWVGQSATGPRGHASGDRDAAGRTSSGAVRPAGCWPPAGPWGPA